MFVPGKPFQSSQLFVGKARSLTRGESERFFNRAGSCFTNKHYTKLERLARDKRSSFVRTFIYYNQKKFNNIGPWSRDNKDLPLAPAPAWAVEAESEQAGKAEAEGANFINILRA